MLLVNIHQYLLFSVIQQPTKYLTLHCKLACHIEGKIMLYITTVKLICRESQAFRFFHELCPFNREVEFHSVYLSLWNV